MQTHIREQLLKWDRLFNEQTNFYNRAAQWAGLSDAAYWVVYCLYQTAETVTQSSLCRDNYFSKQTINSAAARLSRDGYIRLVGQKGGGNRKALELTPEGEALCERVVKPIMQAELGSFAAMTDEERELLLTLTEKQLRLMEKGVEALWR